MPTALEEAQDSLSGGDWRLRLALRMGSLLEGGNLAGPWNVGDNGTSHGPYQIHLPAHPDMTAARANDPWEATRYMLPSYRAALGRVAPELWQGNPMLAAARTAYLAERPAAFYPAERIGWAWGKLAGLAGVAPRPEPGEAGPAAGGRGSEVPAPSPSPAGSGRRLWEGTPLLPPGPVIPDDLGVRAVWVIVGLAVLIGGVAALSGIGSR